MTTVTLPRELALDVLLDLNVARNDLIDDHYLRYPSLWAPRLEELDRRIAEVERAMGFECKHHRIIPRHRALVRVESAHA